MSKTNLDCLVVLGGNLVPHVQTAAKMHATYAKEGKQLYIIPTGSHRGVFHGPQPPEGVAPEYDAAMRWLLRNGVTAFSLEPAVQRARDSLETYFRLERRLNHLARTLGKSSVTFGNVTEEYNQERCKRFSDLCIDNHTFVPVNTEHDPSVAEALILRYRERVVDAAIMHDLRKHGVLDGEAVDRVALAQYMEQRHPFYAETPKFDGDWYPRTISLAQGVLKSPLGRLFENAR